MSQNTLGKRVMESLTSSVEKLNLSIDTTPGICGMSALQRDALRREATVPHGRPPTPVGRKSKTPVGKNQPATRPSSARGRSKPAPKNAKRSKSVPPKWGGAAKNGNTPPKSDLWFVDQKIHETQRAYKERFARLSVEDAYQKKMAKLHKIRERELIGKFFKRAKKKDEMKMQSGIEGAFLGLSDKIVNPEVCSIAEDVMMLTYDLVRARSVLDYVMATVSFAKKRVSGALLHKSIRNSIATFVSSTISNRDLVTMQAGFEENVGTVRDAIKIWPRFKASPLWRKVNSVVVYATSLTLFGDSVTRSKALRIEDSFYKSRAMYQADFAYNVLDLLLFVAERGVQVIKTRKVDPMFHSGSSYESWYDRSSELIAKAQFLSNPKAHGIDIHTFTATLDDLIVKGQSMYKFSCELDKAAKGVIRGTVNQLLLVRASYLNRRVAQQTRRSPLALVLEGHSSVAKTTFANLLHFYYGTLMGKNIEAGARYTRMCSADFWDGFTSDMWSLLIDDAASIRPDVINGVDPSIKEILLAVNNAPFVPDMAKIEDKGAAPFLGELIVITTNSPDLNYQHTFNCPGAAARRTPFHIRIRPKMSLRKNATMIDETKLPALEPGAYPDWWDIEVLEPRLVPMSEDASLEFKQTFELVHLAGFTKMGDFLKWYKSVIERHTLVQDKMAASEEAFRLTKLCPECKMPTGMCACAVTGDAPPSMMDIVQELTAPEDEEPAPPSAFDEVLIGDPDPGMNMQVGWEPFNFTRPEMHPDEMDFYGSLLRSVLWFLVSLLLGGIKFVNWTFGATMLVFMWQFRRFLFDIVTRPRGWTASYLLLRLMMNRMYYGMYDYIVDRAEAAQGEVWHHSARASVLLRECGERVSHTYFAQSRIVQLIIVVLTIALAGFSAYTLFGREKYKMQGNVLNSIGQSPLPGTEPANVWARGVYTPSKLDLGRRSISWKNMTDEQIRTTLGRNCAFIRFREGDHWKVAKCFGLGGQFFMTTNHSVPNFAERIDCQLVRSEHKIGPSGNVNFRLSANDLIRDVSKDIAIFKCDSVPPMRNVTDLFVRERLTQFRANGYYLGRDTHGSVFLRPVTGIHEETYYNPELRSQTQVWWGKAAEVTKYGDCGSVMIGRSGCGPVLLGMHQLGSSSCTVGAIKTTYEDIMRMLNGVLLVSDNEPMLDAPSTKIGTPKDLHPKSPVNFIEEGVIDCYGSFEGFRAEPKFNVEESILAPFLKDRGFTVDHMGPVAKGWRPKHATLSDLVKIDPRVCTDTVRMAVDRFSKDLEKVPNKWKKEIMIYDIHTAVNGVPGLQYVDGLKRNTSAGFPWNKPKQMFLEQLEPTENYPDHVKLTPEIEERVEQMIIAYQNNERAGPVFRAAFKNEPLPIEKAKAGKVRTFMMASVEMTVVMRMYTLSFVRVAQSNHFLFECAPGIEAQSCEWDFLYQYLTQFGVDRTIFGDFRGFDRSMHPVFVNGAFEVIARFIEFCTGDKAHANVVRCIGYDISFAFVDFFGDLVGLYGKNPSGQALTAIVNGIVNSLYMRYVYIHCAPSRDCVSFKRDVALITYGDDNGMGVSKAAPFFTHTSIRDSLGEIGIDYTMADKESESVPYVNIAEGSFLKRTWRRFSETNTMVGPLEMASISKMLMVRIPSSVVSAEVQAVDTIRSANAEFFWHGREVFEEKHAMLLEMVEAVDDLRDLMHPPLEDWLVLTQRYVEASRAFLKRTVVPPFVDISNYRLLDMESGQECPCGGRCSLEGCPNTRTCRLCGWLRFDDIDLECHHCGDQDMCPCCGTGLSVETPRMHILDETMCLRCARNIIFVCPVCGMTNCQRRNSSHNDQFGICPHCGRCELVDDDDDSRCGVCYDDGDPNLPLWHVGDGGTSSTSASQITRPVSIPPASHLPDDAVYASRLDAETPVFRPTMDALGRRRRDNHPVLWAENGDVDEQSTENTEEQYRLQSGVERDVSPNIGADVQVESSSSNEQVQTASFVDSGVGDTLTFAQPQANLFTYDKPSTAELGNFLSRPRLINTITWTPGVLSNSTFDPWSLYLSTTEIAYKLNNYAYLRGNLRVKVVVNAAPFYYGALLMYYTPVPNYIGPLSSTTGVKVQQSQRPHIWIMPQNNEGGEMLLPFFYHKNFIAITSAAEVATLGNLTLVPYAQLASANGATSNGVQMQFYAWMEDADLFGPTVGLAMQAGDEYGNGPVSAPASAVAHWATYLSRVPIIGKFAKATSIGASAVSKMATLFGWSNVPVIDNVAPMKNVPFHDMASAHISEPTTKFLLDPKGELSVDPSLVGLDSADELSISHLVGKESYLATGTWTAGGGAGALIFSSRVSPMLGERGTASTAGTYTCALTPMAWVGCAFGHWRGDVIFRFKVVCSKFHSGRLRIHWDPASSLASTSDYTHVTYTTIVDLQESDEAEFRVPFMQALPWLSLDQGPANANNWSTSAVMAPATTSNGTLTVRVLNNLTAPVDTAVCSVLVFVRGAENLEFANPRDILKGSSLFSMQSGTEPCHGNSPFDERYLLNWGEAIPTVRLLLRRSVLVDRLVTPNVTLTDEAGLFRFYQTRFPPSPGYDPSAYTAAKGIETPATTYKFTYSSMTPLAWFASGFVAMRGAVRWHYNVVNPDGSIANDIFIGRRVGGSPFSAGNQGLECSYLSGAASTATTQSLLKGGMWGAYANTTGLSGLALTNPITQTGVSVEYPMMTNTIFQYANPRNWLLGSAIDGSNADTYQVDVNIHPAAGTGFNRLQLFRYAAAGTDFTLHYFLNTPTVNYHNSMGSVPA